MKRSTVWKSGELVGAGVLALVLGACSGTVGTPGGALGDSGGGLSGDGNKGRGGSPTLGGSSQSLCKKPDVSASPMRRLTHAEYTNAVKALLGSGAAIPDFAADTQSEVFDTMADQAVSSLLADEYVQAAGDLAEGVSDINALVGCTPAGASEACAKDFISRFGRRAFRRPLTSDETTRLSALYESGKAAVDAAMGVRAFVAAVLSSPHFLFRPEFGGGKSDLAGALKVEPYELATRLSFLIWGSIPDDTLLDAAGKGQLASKEQVEAQAERMLEDPRARTASYHFYEQWFGLGLLDAATKDTSVYPTFSDELRTAMGEETRRFVDHVVWEEDGRLETLLTAPYSFVNKSLAQLYGVAGPKDDATYQKTELDPAQRAGVVTQASLMATYASSNLSSPVKRGKWVRERMFCQDLPAPPPNVPPLPEVADDVSTRERFAMHTSAPACASCHKLIDGLGFGLEHYDGIGAFRAKENTTEVDASGSITNTDIDGTYDGGPELANLLAESEQVRDCAVTQMFRYTHGRREEDEDACTVQALQTSFAKSEGDLRQLVLELVKSDAFLNYRAPG